MNFVYHFFRHIKFQRTVYKADRKEISHQMSWCLSKFTMYDISKHGDKYFSNYVNDNRNTLNYVRISYSCSSARIIVLSVLLSVLTQVVN